MNRHLTIHKSIPQQRIAFRPARAAALMLGSVFAIATAAGEEHRKHSEPTIVVIWDSAALQGVRDSHLGPTMVAGLWRLCTLVSSTHGRRTARMLSGRRSRDLEVLP